MLHAGGKPLYQRFSGWMAERGGMPQEIRLQYPLGNPLRSYFRLQPSQAPTLPTFNLRKV